MSDISTYTAFAGDRRVATGAISEIATALCALQDGPPLVQIFDDASGRVVDLDLRHGAGAAAAEFQARSATATATPPARQGRGRPKLGVIAREVTLLPRHWDWLASQPGGASAALRRLVEEARRSRDEPERSRRARDAAYRVMSALAGDMPGFEEASRALFAGDMEKFSGETASWPKDVKTYVLSLANPA